jgi:membrane protein implicated in regulation of membrane protease activity
MIQRIAASRAFQQDQVLIGMSPWTKYLLIQLPGWVLAIVIVTGLRHWLGIPFWIAVGLFFLWVVKDLVMYPLLRTAYESGVKTGIEQLIGVTAIVQEELAPRGYVRVRGELWRAEVMADNGPIPPGSSVRILAAQGMTLIVKPDN